MIRNAYLRKMEAKLRAWGEDIDDLKGKADKATSDVRAKLHEEIDLLRSKEAIARARLRQVRDAKDVNWGKLKVEAERSFEELKKAVDEAIARFRKSA